MQKIKYENQEFNVERIAAEKFGGVEAIEITFEELTCFAKLQDFYDINKNPEVLRRFELYDISEAYNEETGENELVETLQGVHLGYSKPVDLSCFEGVCRVKIQRETEVEMKLKQQQEIIDKLLAATKI